MRRPPVDAIDIGLILRVLEPICSPSPRNEPSLYS
jgi:hypothetical protein